MGGLIADGVRATDVEAFQKALGNRVACVLRVDCPRETLLTRLESRSCRSGDERLGLSDTTDEQGRIHAYMERAAEEESILRTCFDAAAIHTVDGRQPPDVCLRLAVEAVRQSSRAAGEESAKTLERA